MQDQPSESSAPRNAGVSPPLSRRRQSLCRQGMLLVAGHDAVFPHRCLKTNQPTDFFLRCPMSASSPSLSLVLLLSCICPPAGVMLALVTLILAAARVTVALPFSREVISAQRRKRLYAMIAFTAACAFFPLGSMAASPDSSSTLYIVGAGFIFLVSAAAAIQNTLVSIQRMDQDSVFIYGACSEFLDQLPELRKKTAREDRA